MALLQENIIGIDIGTKKLKMVGASGGQIKAALTAEIPEGLIDNYHILSPGDFSKLLKRSVKEGKFPGKKCALCIGSSEAVIRRIVIPDMDEQYIRTNVVAEISSYLPAGADRYVVDFKVQRRFAEGNASNILVMVVAFPKDLLGEYTDCFKSAGLSLKYVDISENSIEKNVAFHKQQNGLSISSFCYVDFGASRTSINMFDQNGRFFINKSVPVGSDTLIKKLAGVTGSSFADAEKLLMSSAGIDEPGSSVNTVFQEHMRSVSSEISRVVTYYINRTRSESIGQMFISGGLSALPGAAEHLRRALQIPVSKFDDVIGSRFATGIPSGGSGMYASAAGIILREVSDGE